MIFALGNCSRARFGPAASLVGDGYNLTTRFEREFIGTFVLVVTVDLRVLVNSPGGACSTAASLTCMIYAPGSCSGAHFDPAVTSAAPTVTT